MKFTLYTMIENKRNEVILEKFTDYILPIIEESEKQLSKKVLEEITFDGTLCSERYKELTSMEYCLKNKYKIRELDINDILDSIGCSFDERKSILDDVSKIIKENI